MDVVVVIPLFLIVAKQLLVEIDDNFAKITSAELEGALFQIQDPILGEKVFSRSFIFRIPIPSTMSPGDFVVPLTFFLDGGKKIVRPIHIRITRRKPLPTRVLLQHIPNIIQEAPSYSGAAIGSSIKALYGDSGINQSELREMVDASRHKAGYQPFQTWRIILRRILTSTARTKNELPEFQQNSSEHQKD